MSKINSKRNIRMIASCGVLTAVAIVLQYIEIPIPIMPSFIKLDLSDLPELLGAYAFGPLAGITIALLKNLIHLFVSQSGFVGELSNFILGAFFSLTAGLIYKLKKTKTGAVIGGISGAIVMAIVSFFSNLFLVYPIYYTFLSKDAILKAYQVILPSISNIEEALLIFNLPFTLIKGLICVAISIVIYKPLSNIIKK